MSQAETIYKISPSLLRELYQHTWYHNLKIPLFYSLLIGCGYVAWNTRSDGLRWLLYGAMGYLWMSIVTFMHDCTHSVLFKARWKNWAFGIFSTLPIIISFVSFKEDHLEHHRYNRTAKDPDAFTMGQRRIGDFILFYAYILIGGILTIIQFTFIYPLQKFDRETMAIHVAELLLRGVVYSTLLWWTAQLGVQGKLLQVWLIPGYIFSLLNSVRFLAEHYATPWNAGQLAGTRTIISNQVNSFFWNNINYHIGHHVYPAVPWYNLQKLHAALLPEISRQRAVVDPSYFGVFFRACLTGPESVEKTKKAVSPSVALTPDRQ
ncbi:MAG: fatty acid desaturase [Candidatus Binatia bacterium]